MEAFSEEIKTYPEWEIDHINGNSLDNRFENLQYVSSSENTIRAYNLGLQDKKKLSLSNKYFGEDIVQTTKHDALL